MHALQKVYHTICSSCSDPSPATPFVPNFYETCRKLSKVLIFFICNSLDGKKKTKCYVTFTLMFCNRENSRKRFHKWILKVTHVKNSEAIEITNAVTLNLRNRLFAVELKLQLDRTNWITIRISVVAVGIVLSLSRDCWVSTELLLTLTYLYLRQTDHHHTPYFIVYS